MMNTSGAGILAATKISARRWICESCRTSLSSKRRSSNGSPFLKVSEEVRQAVAERRPVVALETTIYTHGFPYPENLSLASHLESLVRIHGGVPATIGILDGIARVGFGAGELSRLVSSAGQKNTMKISRRDLGFACGLKDSHGQPYHGGTTIAGTMILAHLAGVRIFATGGLGGVHRGAETTMDISADLTELGRTPVTVISSGCKSFLDLPKTLEYLETQGVGVATFNDGREGSIDFPGFYTRESGVASPRTIHDEAAAARVIHAHFSLGLQSGLHFANPVPEMHSLAKDVMEAAISEAIKQSEAAGAFGAEATPWILAKINEITADKSVVANRALIEANVIRGTKVAIELRKLEGDSNDDNTSTDTVVGPSAGGYASSGALRGLSANVTNKISMHRASTSVELPSEARPDADAQTLPRHPSIIVAGSVAIDLSCDYAPHPRPSANGEALKPALHTSNPAKISQSLGGVGGNVARAAHMMGANVSLCSVVGSDLAGKAVVEGLNQLGMSTTGIHLLHADAEYRTAQYVAINDRNKDLHLAMADMHILESISTDPAAGPFSDLWTPQMQAAPPSHLVLDANWSAAQVAKWFEVAQDLDAHVTFEPVSIAKSARLFEASRFCRLPTFPQPAVHLTTPNGYELAAMNSTARASGAFDRADWWKVIDALGIPDTGARTKLALATSSELVDEGLPQQSIQLLPFVPAVCTKLGSQGVLLTQLIPAGDKRLSSHEYAPYILSRCTNGTENTLGVGGLYMRLFPPVEHVKAEDVVSVNGVGDTFVGTLVAGLASQGPGNTGRLEDLVDIAQRAAVLTLKSTESVNPGLGTLRKLL